MKTSHAFILSLILLSCAEKDINDKINPSGCGVDNPMEDLAWLKEEITK